MHRMPHGHSAHISGLHARMMATAEVGKFGDVEVLAHSVENSKVDEIVDIEENGGENKSFEQNGEPEIVTTRSELWAWYAYYFGNNSAGTLSYAPLSKFPNTFTISRSNNPQSSNHFSIKQAIMAMTQISTVQSIH